MSQKIWYKKKIKITETVKAFCSSTNTLGKINFKLKMLDKNVLEINN